MTKPIVNLDELQNVSLLRYSIACSCTILLLMVLNLITSCDSSSSRVSLGFGETREFADRREITLGWESAADSARLEGTLFLPTTGGPHPVMILHHGSHRWTRDPWNAWFARSTESGIAVVSYDKRGVGRSEGECCPFRDDGYFSLLAGDLLGAARALSSHPEVDPLHIGLYGFSQGGWVVPIAASMAPGEIAFAFIGSGPAVSLGEELLYSDLTGDNECQPSGLSEDEVERRLDAEGPSLFDPRPILEAVTQPVLWQYCSEDTSVPVARSISVLEGIKQRIGSDFDIQLFNGCNHNFVAGGGMCDVDGPRVDWQTPAFEWLTVRGETGSP